MRLLSYKDISELTGISVVALHMRKSRGKMPEPDVDNFQPLWEEKTIRDWMQTWNGSNTKSTN